MPFHGLSAFPLTPLADDTIDDVAFAAQIRRLAAAGVDSITALGSTGSYAYLTLAERTHVLRLAIDNAGSTPVFAGIGALRTSHVVVCAAAAEAAGAAGVLLAPVSYQTLTDDDVYELFRTVTAECSLPVIVYDNPRTTHFTFGIDLYARIAALPGVASIKIPGVPADLVAARAHVERIRSVVPAHVTIGVAGDACAADGLAAGCDVWYSVIAGTLPAPALRIARAAGTGVDESNRLAPLWDLFAEYGSIRVIAAIAEQLGFARRSCLPRPLLGLDDEQRARVAHVVVDLDLENA